ncbi:integrase, catalytic region, zinc finger, CCHC-type containing protein, partial [Tanacetum coccineum]
MNDPNITMEEYIRLEEEKAQKRGKVFNWETAKFGETLSCKPTVSSLNDEIDFRISFEDSNDKGKKSSMEKFAPNDKADYYFRITSITVNEKNAYELKGKFLDDLHNNAFSGTNGNDAFEHIEYYLKIIDPIKLPNLDHDKLRIVIFPISLAGGALWDYWKMSGDEIEVSDVESSDLKEYWKDSKLKDEALRNKAVMEVLISDNESSNDCWKRWKSHEIYYHDYDEGEYENETHEEGHELCGPRERNIDEYCIYEVLGEDILKITILTPNTSYPSRKIRRIRACTHQRPQRKQAQYAVFKEDQYANYWVWFRDEVPPKSKNDTPLRDKRNTYFVRNLEGVDLLKGNRTTNLYSINLDEMASTSPICIMARATSTKSWLWHQSVGISHQASSVKTPQQNGVMEQRNRTLVEAARTMLIFSHAPLFLWDEAISSFLMYSGLCYPKNDREDIAKLGAKGDIGFFVGYSANSCAYRVYNRRTNKIIETMNVTFDELSPMAFE